MEFKWPPSATALYFVIFISRVNRSSDSDFISSVCFCRLHSQSPELICFQLMNYFERLKIGSFPPLSCTSTNLDTIFLCVCVFVFSVCVCLHCVGVCVCVCVCEGWRVDRLPDRNRT